MALPTDKLCHNYLLADIQLATQNFDDKLVIGRGGFGKVYKGDIKSQESGSTIVAIKRLDTTSDQGAPEFVAEIETLSRLRHAHLVSLLGCCVDNKEMIIVYEYMPNGTVDHHLHKGNTSLSWSQRLRISLGAARGLEYLHTGAGTRQGVVHRDVKSSNILLDEDWEAKISDFGLAKTCPINQSRTYVNTRIKGTFGYLDPQIFLTGNLTRKTDVFAFGVVLFELLSGRHAVLPDGDEDLSLATWAQSCVRKRNLDKLVSAEIRGELSPKCLKEFTQIAYRCLHSDPKERPTMAEVVVVLQLSERLQEQFDNSTQPAGFFGFVWKLPSYFSSPTRENSGHDDKSSSRKGKINIIRSSVANDGDLSDLHTESSGASKINSDSSSVPTTDDGGNYKDENASAKVTKAMQTFIEEHRSATELMSLRHKEELEDERPSRVGRDSDRFESLKSIPVFLENFRMSVIGFDIGNVNCVIAAAKRGGIDVLVNDEAKRETPGVVSFGDKQRFLGSAGAAFATANPKSTISQIKRLIGRQYKEPSVQEELKLLPFVTSEGPRGGILIELEYMKEKMMFTPVEILGMLFKHLKQIAEKNIESPVADCVIGIPSYFTDLQRREYLDAAVIAGLKPLMLMHDGTATALGYGMCKSDLSDKGPTVVVFVDIGHCDTQVTLAAFEQGKMKILSHTFDQNLGGRDFDELLFEHFAAQFKERYKIDVHSNARASIRLRASCEKLKKVLSAKTEAPLSIECLIEDTDVRGIMTREEFENLSQELLERVTVPCIKAVEDSGVSVDKIYTIELVGSGSRIPAIVKKLTSLFKKEPTRTLNASECVARGCALRCAMLSPTLQVQPYKVQDFFPYSIGLSIDEGQNKANRYTLFPKGISFPANKKITYHGTTPLNVQVFYANKKDFPAIKLPKVGHFMIGAPESSGEEKVRTVFKVLLNKHGIVALDSAIILEDENAYSYLQKMMGNNHTSKLPFSENLVVATTEDELRQAQKREWSLAEQDKKLEQTKDQRNTLKSFVYDTRSKLSSAYRSYATDTEKDRIIKSLQETEDWFCEDRDDESDEENYSGKLEELKKLLDPIEKRYKDEIARAKETKAIRTFVEEYRTASEKIMKLAIEWHKPSEISASSMLSLPNGP